MSISRVDALAAARKLLRTFASAPDPKQRSRAICAELMRASDWTHTQRAAIEELSAWLRGYPPSAELRLRCERLLARLREFRGYLGPSARGPGLGKATASGSTRFRRAGGSSL